MVPEVQSSNAKIKITAIDAEGNLGFAESGSFSLNQTQTILAYPNQVKVSSASGITLVGPSNSFSLRIFNVLGETVQSFSNVGPSVTWDLKNSEGNLCSEGVYLYLVTSASGIKNSGKIVIVK